MHDIVALFFIGVSFVCVGGYVIVSLVIQLLTWIDDGEGTLFKGYFRSLNLSQLTAGGSHYDRMSKELLLPWVLVEGYPKVPSKREILYSWILGLIALAFATIAAVFVSLYWKAVLIIFGVAFGIVAPFLLARWIVRLYKKILKSSDDTKSPRNQATSKQD